MLRPAARAILALAVVACVVAPAAAEDRLTRIRDTHLLRCAAETRPGFADTDGAEVDGLAVALCRAVALAVLGPEARVEVDLPETDEAFDAIRHGARDIALLSPRTVQAHALAGALVPGPAVFLDPVQVMVPRTSQITTTADLAGRALCLIIASKGQAGFEATLGRGGLAVARLGFREDVEMLDAYNVGRCDAVVDLATRLAEMRRQPGLNKLQSRLLQPPLAIDPILALTPATDASWAATVGWLLHALLADQVTTPIPPDLRPHWRADVAATLGSYADMLARTVGGKSDLGLPIWPNAPWPIGLLLPAGLE